MKSTLISDYQNSDEDMGSDYQKEIYIYDEERLSAAVVYGLPKTYEFPGFITEIFSDWMKETDKKMWDDDWWKEPDIYEFVYDEKGKPTKCFVVDPKTGKREGYRLSFNSYVHVEELKRIYKPVFR